MDPSAAIPSPGTIDELLDDARAFGWEDVSDRLLREWHAKGLLGSPQRRPRAEGGSGQAPALYSSPQRALFRWAVRLRSEARANPSRTPFSIDKYQSLASLPVYAWMRFGSDWVDNEQLRRALKTSLGPNPKKSRRAAQLSAAQFVKAIDINGATLRSRLALRESIAKQLQRGRNADVDELRPLIAAVLQPQGLSVVNGPTESTTLIDANVYGIRARMRAARNLAGISDEDLETARLRYIAGRPSYETEYASMSAHPNEALANMFDVRLETEVRNIVPGLLLLLGMELLQRDEQSK